MAAKKASKKQKQSESKEELKSWHHSMQVGGVAGILYSVINLVMNSITGYLNILRTVIGGLTVFVIATLFVKIYYHEHIRKHTAKK